jgi:hypothetical protein
MPGGGTAVVRASQSLGDDAVSEANPARLAHARWRMRSGEGAPVPDANGRNRGCRRRIVRRPPRPRKVKPQSDDEVAEAQGDPLLGVTVRVIPSPRACPSQPPAKVASVALSPPQPASAKVAIAAAARRSVTMRSCHHSQPSRQLVQESALVTFPTLA